MSIATVIPLSRNNDLPTSQAAERALAEDTLTRQQHAILEILREHPDGLTDRQLTRIYGNVALDRDYPLTELDSVRKRRSMLTRKGLVITKQFVRDPKTNRDAAIWRAVDVVDMPDLVVVKGEDVVR